MKWQKASILKSRLFPHMIGQHVWVENRPPLLTGYIEVQTHNEIDPAPCLYSQLCDDFGNRMVFATDYLELTGEFTDKDLVEIPYAVWTSPDYRAS